MSLQQKRAAMNKYNRLQNLSKQMAEVLQDTNKTAQSFISKSMQNVYKMNYNFSAEQLGFSLLDNTAVKNILTGEVNPFTKLSIAGELDKRAIMRKLESELIVGAGGTGVVSGLLDPGNFTAHTAASGDSLADAVSKAKAVMDAAGWNPGLVIAHPTDWEVLCRERESGGAGAYVAGSWRDPTPPSIWGVPVITNAAVTAGSFIILDPSQVLVLDREDTTIEVGYADDDFVRNRIRILAEMRAGLAVLSPGAVIAGDFEP